MVVMSHGKGPPPMIHRLLVASAVFLLSAPAFAAAVLTVNIAPPAGVHVYETGRYNVSVSNTGNQTSTAATLTIQLPLTRTSPTVAIMGQLGARDSRCALSGTKLVCSLGTIKRNNTKTVFFDIALPYSTMPITFGATLSNSASTGSYVASLLPYSTPLSVTTPVKNRHCTGTSWLSSFFECELFPSSISSHDTALNADGSISFVGAPGSYTGTWNQPSPDRLQFRYYDGTTLEVDFDGRAVGAGCFEGMTVFPASSSSYISMYEVCPR